MALAERPSDALALPSGGGRERHPAGRLHAARAPRRAGGRWVTTVDHKKIGIMYGARRCSSS